MSEKCKSVVKKKKTTKEMRKTEFSQNADETIESLKNNVRKKHTKKTHSAVFAYMYFQIELLFHAENI